ncbi:MAG TPA: hypothetical protein VK601_23255, partial [Kofleriaceae bacterium]|nr:hypothetical protein [Kofleriaceae bacterium]
MRGALAALGCAAAAGCGSFQDPNIVLDLRVLAIQAEPADQVVDVDLTAPPNPSALLAQLVPTQVCALVADPALDRRLVWTMTMCPLTLDARCDDGRPQVALGGGLLDDPDTSVPAPPLCATVMPDAQLLGVLLDVLQGDDFKGLGGLDYAVTLRIGGEAGDRELDQYATKTLRVSPRIPADRAANHNPGLDRIDAALEDGTPVALPLGRCLENAEPYPLRAGAVLRLTPVEPDGARERYVVPTLDGRSETFTESLTYQWTASLGGLSHGSTGGPR